MELPTLNLIIIFVGAFGALAYMAVNRFQLSRMEVGEPALLVISGRIKIGVASFIRRQHSIAFKVMVGIFLLLFYLSTIDFLSVYTPYAVFSGAFFAALSAYFGLTAGTEANAITAYQTKYGISRAYRDALKGGSVMSFSVAGFGLLDLGFWYLLIYLQHPNMPTLELMQVLTSTIITFAFGASFMAFMARVAGGIFTKSADSAADSVGKGEYGWSEDDPRNPATIADNVGDNASDIDAMGKDLNESYVGANAASMEAGYMSFQNYAIVFGVTISASLLVMLPLAISVIGIFASMIGLAVIRPKSNDFKALLTSTRRGIYLTSLLIVVFSAPMIYFVFHNWNLLFGVIFGLLTGNAIAFISEYYTSTSYAPVRRLAAHAEGGHASVVVEGEAIGKESVVPTALVLMLGMLAAYFSVGSGNFYLGIYGVSLAAVGMLSTNPITLAIDAFGPIADNAQGILEMTGVKGERAQIANNLDSLGNTTAATGKGYAIGSAAFAAIALINALWHVIDQSTVKYNLPALDINAGLVIWVLAGLLLGMAIPWFFSSYLLRAVGNTALIMIKEIRRQVRELNIMSGENEPDYQKCITIALTAAQKYSIVPAILVILIPFIVFVVGGPVMIMSFLVGSMFSAFCLAVYQANSGGAWDNAKKYIEAGFLGGKNTDAHRAAITGDMVGDPYKDTAGPALNILIKLMVTFSILMAPLALYLHNLLF